jgi:hypothetical protein
MLRGEEGLCNIFNGLITICEIICTAAKIYAPEDKEKRKDFWKQISPVFDLVNNYENGKLTIDWTKAPVIEQVFTLQTPAPLSNAQFIFANLGKGIVGPTPANITTEQENLFMENTYLRVQALTSSIGEMGDKEIEKGIALHFPSYLEFNQVSKGIVIAQTGDGPLVLTSSYTDTEEVYCKLEATDSQLLEEVEKASETTEVSNENIENGKD